MRARAAALGLAAMLAATFGAGLAAPSALAAPDAHARSNAPDAGAGSLAAIRARKALRVGMFPGLMPFVAVGADADELARLAPAARVARAVDGRRVAGFDVDLAEAAARALGVELQIVLVDRFDDLLRRLNAGQYDVVMSGLTRTLPRAIDVAFSDPYFASGLQVFVREGARFATLPSLGAAHARVVVRAATTAEAFARANLAGAVITTVGRDAEVFDALERGRADAIVIDYVTARDAAVRGHVRVPLLPIEDRRFTVEHFAFAVRHGDLDWLGWLNLLLRETKASGEFHALAARYNAWFRSER